MRGRGVTVGAGAAHQRLHGPHKLAVAALGRPEREAPHLQGWLVRGAQRCRDCDWLKVAAALPKPGPKPGLYNQALHAASSEAEAGLPNKRAYRAHHAFPLTSAWGHCRAAHTEAMDATAPPRLCPQQMMREGAAPPDRPASTQPILQAGEVAEVRARAWGGGKGCG